jgi:cell division protease FtsH
MLKLLLILSMQCLYINAIASEKTEKQEAERIDQRTIIENLRSEVEFYKNKDKKNIFKNIFENENIGQALSVFEMIFIGVIIQLAPLYINSLLSCNNKYFNTKEIKKIFFKDIGGYQDKKKDILDIVNEAKVNKQNTNMTSILLYGPSGTGKTQLAQAVANEAKLPYAIINPTDILGKFLGESENNIKNILNEARKNAPCILFIDEIDFLLNNKAGIYSSTETNIKKILQTYMDGTENINGVILIGATNYRDNIPPEFLRNGRFEDQFFIDYPDYTDRLDIIKIMLKKNNLTLASSITIEYIAERTESMTGAQINSIVKNIKKKAHQGIITMENFTEYYLNAAMGKINNTIIINEKEKNNTAMHESGHALISYLLDKEHKSYLSFDLVSINPRGSTLGASHCKRESHFKSFTKEHSLNMIATYLAGRIAQEITGNNIDAGASNDIEKATKIAEDMIVIYGFDEENISQKHSPADIVKKVNTIMNTQYDRIKKFLIQHKELLIIISNELIRQNTLYKDDIKKIVEEYEENKNIKVSLN